jgi:hypothetical protein
MKKLGLSKMTSYNILVDGKVLFTGLTDDEMFDRLDDLALEYYQCGDPEPGKIKTQIIREDN